MSPEQGKIIIESDEFAEGQAVLEDTLRVLAFSLNKENYCIDVTQAKEVFTPGLVTRVPNSAGFIKGVTNLHGLIVPLVDIRPFLGLAQSEITKESKVIGAEIKGGLVGIVVDKIFEARQIAKSAVQPPLATLKGEILDFTLGQIQVESGIITYLDLKKILELNEFKNGGGQL